MVSNSGYVKMQKPNKQAKQAAQSANGKPQHKGKQWTRTDTKRSYQGD